MCIYIYVCMYIYKITYVTVCVYIYICNIYNYIYIYTSNNDRIINSDMNRIKPMGRGMMFLW